MSDKKETVLELAQRLTKEAEVWVAAGEGGPSYAMVLLPEEALRLTEALVKARSALNDIASPDLHKSMQPYFRGINRGLSRQAKKADKALAEIEAAA